MTQRCTIKKRLTALVNRNSWLIYRLSQHGMYAINKEMDIAIPLMIWNITLKDPDLNNIVAIIRTRIDEAERA